MRISDWSSDVCSSDLYTVLTQEQVAAYLAALDNAGGFASFGALNAFFGQYYAFIAAGGDPAKFAGLPAYADYLAALQTYYAFLLGGGQIGRAACRERVCQYV